MVLKDERRLQVVVAAHRAALPDLKNNFAWVEPEDLVVVTNGPDPLTVDDFDASIVINDTESDKNISRWWNLGIDGACADANDRAENSDILIMNADAQIIGDVRSLQEELHRYRLRVVHPDAHNMLGWDEVRINHVAGPIPDLKMRMSGFAFMMTAENPIYADEQFRWWYGDDDLEWRARQEGGVGAVGDVSIIHPASGAHWDGIEDTIAADRQRFIDKWGVAPHNFGPGA